MRSGKDDEILVGIALNCGVAKQRADVRQCRRPGGDCTENGVTRIMEKCSDGTARRPPTL
jgi:hypothetical protein